MQSGQERLREAAKHGFKRAIVPHANAPKKSSIPGLEIIAVHSYMKRLLRCECIVIYILSLLHSLL